MQAQPLVSIVIPTLNEEKYLPRTLESFKKQSYKNFEIVISDGGSKDKTVEIAKNAGIKVIETPHPTITTARQKGIDAARGEIIVGADADTFYPADHLQKLVTDYAINDNIVAVGGPSDFPKEPWWVYLGWKIVYGLNIFYSTLGLPTYIAAFNLSFRKDAFDKIGGYNTYLDWGGDERDIIGRLRKVGQIYYDPTLIPLSSNRRSKVGFFQFIIKQGLIDYYVSYYLAKIFKKTIIKGQPVR